MNKLYANYGRKNKPREGPYFLGLMAFSQSTSGALYASVIQLFSIVISKIHNRSLEPNNALFYGGCVTH
ncbi:hypothetical protein EMIT0196MI5_20343 [Pseudomonas sp. IT-196MI5]